MNANDILAQMAGLSNLTEIIPDADLLPECEEVSYDDMEDTIYDTVVEKEVPLLDDHHGNRSRRSRVAGRELRGLSFANPGEEMSKMLPDSADIVSTYRSRRTHPAQQSEPKEPKDIDLHHDKTGKLSSITKGKTEVYDLCDCLRKKCSGCNWPCKNCKSRKCMIGCRQNRKEMVLRVEEMFTKEQCDAHAVFTNPFYPYHIKD